MGGSQSKAYRGNRIQTLITGLEEYCDNRTMGLDGTAVKCSVVVQMLQKQLTLQAQVTSARQDLQQAVAAQRNQYASIKDIFSQVEKYVAGAFGVGSKQYVAMGFTPPKKKQVSPRTMVQAAEQNKATRKARNTMGRKQKLAIRGVVPTASSQPASTTPVTPATATAPSSSSPNGTGTPSH